MYGLIRSTACGELWLSGDGCGLIATLVAALLATAAVTAVLAGRRAVSIDAVRAVSNDW